MTYQEALANIPAPGTGCHPYLLTAANCGVLSGLDDETIVADIQRNIPKGRREVLEKEIRDAVAKARATAHGNSVPAASQENRAIGWNDPLPAGVAPVLVSGSMEMTEHVASPKEWKPLDDFRNYMTALFRDTERPMIQIHAYEQDGGWRIAGPGACSSTLAEILAQLDRMERMFGEKTALDMTLGSPTAGGAWVRVNPMDGKGCFDVNVTAYRNALVECDTLDLDRQLAIIRKLRLPCAAITYSGGKSVHAVVKVGAHSLKDYHDRFEVLLKVCKANGLDIDKGNRNPSRFTRAAGFLRGEEKQYLIDRNCGCGDWDEWCDFIASVNDDLPEFTAASEWLESLPELTPCVIEGVLRRRHKLLVTGPSKAGKSYLLMELADVIATGGDWLGWRCVKGRVLYINLELDPASCAFRFHELWKASGMVPDNGMLDVWNLRGHGMGIDRLTPPLIRRTRERGYSAIIVDPLYKVQTGDENTAGDMTAFYNHFDRIAEATGAAIILCHHHSKGAQGQKRAQDRASGSGVFARDPDALLDMIQLNLTEDMRKAVSEHWLRQGVEKIMDNGRPDWREKVADTVRERADRLWMEAKDVDEEAALEIRAQSEGWKESVSLWRIDGILREFPAFPPKRVWFRWPVHLLDDTGFAEDALADGEQPTRAQIARKSAAEARCRADEVRQEFENLAAQGEVTVEALCDRVGCKQGRSFARLLKAAGLQKKKDKVVMRNEAIGFEAGEN